MLNNNHVVHAALEWNYRSISVQRFQDLELMMLSFSRKQRHSAFMERLSNINFYEVLISNCQKKQAQLLIFLVINYFRTLDLIRSLLVLVTDHYQGWKMSRQVLDHIHKSLFLKGKRKRRHSLNELYYYIN